MDEQRFPRRSGERRDVRSIFALLVVVAVTVGAASTAGAGSPSLSPSDMTFPAPLPGMGGYNWIGAVKQIGARWTVPTIFKSSRAGQAATWIGAQNDHGNDFIQIGILETRDVTGVTEYRAFWSDTAVNYSPQDLGSVRAGDSVTVQMVRKGFGWSLRLQDRSSALYVNRQIDYGFEEPFDQGEWIQENPSSSSSGLPVLPYPAISDVTFQDLAINGAAPQLSVADGQVLITSGHRYRVPTSVRNNKFSLHVPTPTQLNFLNDMRPSDLEATVFGFQFAHWAATTKSQRTGDVAIYAATLRSSTNSIARRSWPRPTQSAVQRYLHSCNEELRALTSWSHAGAPLKGPFFTQWSVSELQREFLADDVRSSLALPPAY